MFLRRTLAGLAVALTLAGSASAQVDTLTPAVQHIQELEQAGKLAEALAAAQALLQSVTTQSGGQSADVASCLLRVSGLQLEMNQAASAVTSAQQAVGIDQQKLGPDAAATLEAKDYLAAALAATKQYDQAQSVLNETLQSATRNGSTDEQITAIDSIATLEIQEGHYPEAEANLSKEVELYKASKDSDKSDYIGALQDLALVERQNNHYTQAEAVLRRALDISLKAYPPGADERLESMRDLAFLLMDVGHYAEASRELTSALDESVKASGPNSRQSAGLDTDNALLATEMGDYQRAARLLSAALHAEELLFGKDSPYLVRTLNTLGEANLQAGDYKLAEASLRRAMQIVKAKTGSNDPYLLERLASVYLAQGKLTKAEPLLNEELHGIMVKEGNDHPDTIVPMLAIANLKAARGQVADAAKLYDHALAILQKSAGPEHFLTVSTRLRRALLAFTEGNQDAATTAATEVTPILAKSTDSLATADNLKLLAVLDHDLDKNDEALVAAKRAAKIEDRLLTDVLSFTSEQERLSFEQTTDPYSVLGTLGSAPDLAAAVLRHKGIVLDSMLEDVKAAEHSTNPALKNDILALRDAKRSMTDMVLEHGGDPRYEPQRQQLRKAIEELQRTLASKGMAGQSRSALETKVADVQARIPAHTVMVEYIRYNRHTKGLSWVPSYGAVVLAHEGAPKWVALSDARDVDDTIEYYRRAVRSTPSEESMKQILHELYARTWGPAAKVFPAGTKYVIVCPDSQLNAVSFATLLSKQNKFVAEQYLLSYVASGRDLLRDLHVVKTGPMVVFANPDFKGTGTGAKTRGIETTRGISTESTRGIGNETTRGIGNEQTRGIGDEVTRGAVDDEATRGISDEATRG
ncbi:MAG: tetratricopeptide repeat protein, partial [Candidatus Xenobia bacterium]